MDTSEQTDGRSPGWRRIADRFLLLSWKRLAVIIAAWALAAGVHGGTRADLDEILALSDECFPNSAECGSRGPHLTHHPGMPFLGDGTPGFRPGPPDASSATT